MNGYEFTQKGKIKIEDQLSGRLLIVLYIE